MYPLYYLFVFVLYFVKFTIYLIFWSQEVASHQSFIDFYEILSLITHAVSTPFATYILALLHPVGYHLLYSTHMLQSSIEIPFRSPGSLGELLRNMCHKLPRICSADRFHNPVILFSFIIEYDLSSDL